MSAGSDCLCETVGKAGSAAKIVVGAASKVRDKGSPSGLKLGAVVKGAGNAAASIGRAGKSGISGHGVGLSGAINAGAKVLVGPRTTVKGKALVSRVRTNGYVSVGKGAKALVNVAAPVKARVYANTRTGAKASAEVPGPVKAKVFAHVGNNANAKADVGPVKAKVVVRAGTALPAAHVHFPGCGH